MSFDVQPVGRNITPASSMFSVPIGDITMTHFRYGGVEVDLQNFDPTQVTSSFSRRSKDGRVTPPERVTKPN